MGTAGNDWCITNSDLEDIWKFELYFPNQQGSIGSEIERNPTKKKKLCDSSIVFEKPIEQCKNHSKYMSYLNSMFHNVRTT